MKLALSVTILFFFSILARAGDFDEPRKKGMCNEIKVALTDDNGMGLIKGQCMANVENVLNLYSCCLPGFYNFYYKESCPSGTKKTIIPDYNEGVITLACGTKDKDGVLQPRGKLKSWLIHTQKVYEDLVYDGKGGAKGTIFKSNLEKEKALE